MSRRSLPVIAAPQAPLHAAHQAVLRTDMAAERRTLDVDGRCFAVVCDIGLDAAAEWVAALRSALGEPVPCVFALTQPPITERARALVAAGVPFAGDAPAAPIWLLVADAGFAPAGARVTVVVGEPARRLGWPGARAVLAPERPSVARALGAALSVGWPEPGASG